MKRGWKHLALKDRRQDIRELAAVALSTLADSGFRGRAIARVRERVKIERRLLKRVIAVETAGRVRSRVGGGRHQGKAAAGHRRESMVAAPDDCPRPARRLAGTVRGRRKTNCSPWPATRTGRNRCCSAGSIPRAACPPARCPRQFLPFIATLEPWPTVRHAAKHRVMAALLDASLPPIASRCSTAWRSTAAPVALDLLARCGEASARRYGKSDPRPARRGDLSIPDRLHPPASPRARPLHSARRHPVASRSPRQTPRTLRRRRGIRHHSRIPPLPDLTHFKLHEPERPPPTRRNRLRRGTGRPRRPR